MEAVAAGGVQQSLAMGGGSGGQPDHYIWGLVIDTSPSSQQRSPGIPCTQLPRYRARPAGFGVWSRKEDKVMTS